MREADAEDEDEDGEVASDGLPRGGAREADELRVERDAAAATAGETGEGSASASSSGAASSMLDGEMSEVDDDADGAVASAVRKRPAADDGPRAVKRSPARVDADEDDEALLDYGDPWEGVGDD